MGQVIPIRTKEQASLLERAEDIVNRIKKGELVGMMDVLCRSDGRQESGTNGVFAHDLDLAVVSARDGFNCLLGHKACLEAPNQLPLRLRKEYKHEEKHCAVTACGSRR